jgi:hypothetical protein
LAEKQLMYIGSFGYIISLTLVALSFFFGWKGLSVPVFLFVFIAAHAVGQGTVIWVFIAELFPTHLRASGQAFGSSVHWVLAAAIPSLIPFLFSTVGAGLSLLFCHHDGLAIVMGQVQNAGNERNLARRSEQEINGINCINFRSKQHSTSCYRSQSAS